MPSSSLVEVEVEVEVEVGVGVLTIICFMKFQKMIIYCNQSFSRISLTSISTKNMQMIYWENYYEVEWYKKLCTPIPAFSVFFNLIIHYISNLVKSYIW